MKILLASPSMRKDYGGPTYSIGSINKYLSKCGHVSKIITKASDIGDLNLEVFNKHLLDNFDVVHNFGLWTFFNFIVSKNTKSKNIPLILCPMGMLEPWAMNQKKIKKIFGWHLYQKKIFNECFAVQATSAIEANNLLNLGIKTPIALIPHGMDLPPSLEKKSAEPNIDRLNILFLSRIHPKKGLLDLVGACARLGSKNWQVTIAGIDEEGYQKNIEMAVREAHLEDNFRFVGPVFGADKSILFSEADIFILPTYSENFGLVIPEALAHSTPVITTTETPWQEINEFRCGWWIKPGIDSVEAALRIALSTPRSELREMGKRGRSLVKEKYSWESVILKHLQLYSWAIKLNSKPSFIIN